MCITMYTPQSPPICSRSTRYPHATYTHTFMTEKELIYRAHIQRSLVEMYQHMEQMLTILPDDEEIDGDALTDKQLEVIERVEAIEQEWIVDPDQREALSLINWT